MPTATPIAAAMSRWLGQVSHDKMKSLVAAHFAAESLASVHGQPSP